jgi:hypothetical protein
MGGQTEQKILDKNDLQIMGPQNPILVPGYMTGIDTIPVHIDRHVL